MTNNIQKILFFSVLLFFSACKSTKDCGCVPPPPPFGNQTEQGSLENVNLKEASGLVASRSNASMLWSHNDSGNDAKVFLLNTNGKNFGEFTLSGVSNRDWEDIAIMTENGKNYILVGDIGDNDAVHNSSFIYKFEEPNVSNISSANNQTIASLDIQKIEFQYVDGKRDAETLLVDPITKDIYIISKRETQVGIYRLAYPQSTTSVLTAEKLGTLNYTYIVGGDISPDGKEILLKTYDKVLYWKRDNTNTSIGSLFQQIPNELPYTLEGLGEAIAWKSDASGYFTTAEGLNAKLYFYKRN